MLCNFGFAVVASFAFDARKFAQTCFTNSAVSLLHLEPYTEKRSAGPSRPLVRLDMSQIGDVTEHPGDPSLILTTNVDLGEKKLDVMKACSAAIAEHTGKPESYVAVTITDNVSVLFGGSDAPAALGCLYSIGGISQESNGRITAAVTDALAPFSVAAERVYINFFDVPRANVGWNRRTFAG